jgi:hypothetical protein
MFSGGYVVRSRRALVVLPPGLRLGVFHVVLGVVAGVVAGVVTGVLFRGPLFFR